MVKRIVNFVSIQENRIGHVFQALSDPTRRSIIDRLIAGPATVNDLARPLEMSLPAVMRHLSVLEGCGLIASEKVGRVRTCHIEPAALRSAEAWLAERRTDWEIRLDRLGDYLAEPPVPPVERKM